MKSVPDSDALLTMLKAGDRRAAEAIFQRFAGRLVGMARVRLDERLRQKVDAEDVIQSVFRSFFERSARGEFDFSNWEGVWGLLVLLTVRKCGRRAKYFQTDRRDTRREVTIVGGTSSFDLRLVKAIADEPTAEEAAILTETTGEIMRSLRTDKERQIFELSLQGYSIAEISNFTCHYERGVERVRNKIRTMLEERLGGSA